MIPYPLNNDDAPGKHKIPFSVIFTAYTVDVSIYVFVPAKALDKPCMSRSRAHRIRKQTKLINGNSFKSALHLS